MEYQPNSFLRSRDGHGRRAGFCFCEECRDLKVRSLDGVGLEEARVKFCELLPIKREEKLDHIFSLTCEQIIYGEYYKRSALQQVNHTQFKRWARKEFPDLSEKELENFSTKINYASQAYRFWDQIVVNLTSDHARWIDAREFSIERFARSNQLTFVITMNTAMKPKFKTPSDEDKSYSEESYQRLLSAIHQNGILKEIDFNPRVASSIIHRIQGDVTRYCLRKGPESVPQQEQDESF